MRIPADLKKLVSFSVDSKDVREKIAEVSIRTGLSNSRIIEDCMICGYGFLYGSEEDAEHIVDIMRQRYGNIIDVDWLKQVLRSGDK